MPSNTLSIAEQKKQNRISRKLTVNIQEPYISIRPIIKKADSEAAHTLSEAYVNDVLLDWLTGTIKDKTKLFHIYQDIFKALIRTSASESREFAIQLNGCKGVLLWSEGHSKTLSIGNVMSKKRLWGTLGGLATMRATLIHHRHLVKEKKELMAGRNYLSINFVGVLQADQRKNIGTALIKYVLKKADDAQLPVFAEVWGQVILSWFQKHDFVVQDSKNFSNVTVYYVVREPQVDAQTPLITSPEDTIAALHLEPPRDDGCISQQEA